MNILGIALYVSIILYLQVFIFLMILQNLSKNKKIIILDFLSSYFDIKIYYKQRIYNRTIKNKLRPDYIPDAEIFQIQRNNIGLIHYKSTVQFIEKQFVNQYNFQPEYIDNLFGKNVTVCPQVQNLDDLDKFKLYHIIQKIQTDVKQMILQNPNLLVKNNNTLDDTYSSYPPVESWSFDLFLPNKPIPQKVEFGALM